MKCSLSISHLSLVQHCVCSVGSGNRNPAWAMPQGSGSENPLPCFCSELILWSLTGEQRVCDISLLVWTKLGLCQILLLRRAGALDIPVHRVWVIGSRMSDAAVFWSFLSQCTHRAHTQHKSVPQHSYQQGNVHCSPGTIPWPSQASHGERWKPCW